MESGSHTILVLRAHCNRPFTADEKTQGLFYQAKTLEELRGPQLDKTC